MIFVVTKYTFHGYTCTDKKYDFCMIDIFIFITYNIHTYIHNYSLTNTFTFVLIGQATKRKNEQTIEKRPTQNLWFSTRFSMIYMCLNLYF